MERYHENISILAVCLSFRNTLLGFAGPGRNLVRAPLVRLVKFRLELLKAARNLYVPVLRFT